MVSRTKMRIKTELPLTLDEVLYVTGGIKRYNSSVTINAITTNSKESRKGDLFIAIKGERFDGEDFIEEAKSNGAFCISSFNRDADITVNDTAMALLKISGYYRTKNKSLKTTIAITGSVGKTTTKNILSTMLSKHFKVHSTNGNYNNILGVSYTLLSLPKDTQILVLELGMNHFGELELLSKATNPDIAVITNIGTAHIGNFGSRELIAKAKLEILSGMKNECLIIPNDELLLKNTNNPITVSVDRSGGDYSLFTLRKMIDSTVFKAILKDKIIYATVNLPGKHILSSIINSIAVMDVLGLSEENIISSISAVNKDCAREKIYNIGNVIIYDDSYNSSPEAVKSTLENINELWNQRKSCVIGDMLELGCFSEEFHRKIGAEIFKTDFDKLYAYGVYAPFIARGAMDAGMEKDNIFINTDTLSPKITAREIFKNMKDGELILFKASHSVHVDKIIDELKIAVFESQNDVNNGGINNA